MAQNETLKLLASWSSPYAVRVQVALHLKSVKYEYVDEPDVLKGKSQLLLKSNPVYKKVPVLIHGDVSICESLNIVQYVDEAWPSDPSILPSHPYDRATARFWAQYADEKCFSALDAVRRAKNDEGRMAEAAGNLIECLTTLEDAFQKLSKGLGFFGGEHIGFVDISCGGLLGPIAVMEALSGVKFMREETTAGLIQWAKRFKDHEAVKPYMPNFEEFVAFAMQKLNVE